jgi:hypothetical protein
MVSHMRDFASNAKPKPRLPLLMGKDQFGLALELRDSSVIQA